MKMVEDFRRTRTGAFDSWCKKCRNKKQYEYKKGIRSDPLAEMQWAYAVWQAEKQGYELFRDRNGVTHAIPLQPDGTPVDYDPEE